MLYLFHPMQPNFRLARVHLFISSFVYSDFYFYLFISFIMSYRFVNSFLSIKTKSQTHFIFMSLFSFLRTLDMLLTLDPRHVTLDP